MFIVVYAGKGSLRLRSGHAFDSAGHSLREWSAALKMTKYFYAHDDKGGEFEFHGRPYAANADQ